MDWCEGAVDESEDAVDAMYDAVDDWCSGNGDCDWTTDTCDCDTGYYGTNCSGVCPGGADSPCSGQGTCDSDTGACYCECGYSGDDCSEVGCCLQDADLCTFGDSCNISCGALVTLYETSTCTGSYFFETGECECAEGWYGSLCNATCPGINATTGAGDECGGYGTCDDNGVRPLCICRLCGYVVFRFCVGGCGDVMLSLHFASPSLEHAILTLQRSANVTLAMRKLTTAHARRKSVPIATMESACAIHLREIRPASVWEHIQVRAHWCL